MKIPKYVPHLSPGSRTVFIRKDHPRAGQYCTILDPLPNPSQRSINQWYDVRFDDGPYLRCHERNLQQIRKDDATEPDRALGPNELMESVLMSQKTKS